MSTRARHHCFLRRVVETDRLTAGPEAWTQIAVRFQCLKKTNKAAKKGCYMCTIVYSLLFNDSFLTFSYTQIFLKLFLSGGMVKLKKKLGKKYIHRSNPVVSMVVVLFSRIDKNIPCHHLPPIVTPEITHL